MYQRWPSKSEAASYTEAFAKAGDSQYQGRITSIGGDQTRPHHYHILAQEAQVARDQPCEAAMASPMSLARHQFARLDGVAVARRKPCRWSRGTPAAHEKAELPDNQAGKAPDSLQDQADKALSQAESPENQAGTAPVSLQEQADKALDTAENPENQAAKTPDLPQGQADDATDPPGASFVQDVPEAAEKSYSGRTRRERGERGEGRGGEGGRGGRGRGGGRRGEEEEEEEEEE